MRAALYLRVSTAGRTVANQHRELLAVAAKAGWEVVDVYADEGVSGSKERLGRPEFDRLLRDAARRRFDLVAAWSVDRLGRSLQDLAAFLAELHDLGLGLYLHQQGLDTTTPSGKAMFQMMGVFAEFERAMIRERVNAGLARAKARGRRLGRPRLPSEVEARILELRRAGKGMNTIAREVGCGTSAVQRVLSGPSIPSPPAAGSSAGGDR